MKLGLGTKAVLYKAIEIMISNKSLKSLDLKKILWFIKSLTYDICVNYGKGKKGKSDESQ